jgi:hypothetical protein
MLLLELRPGEYSTAAGRLSGLGNNVMIRNRMRGRMLSDFDWGAYPATHKANTILKGRFETMGENR